MSEALTGALSGYSSEEILPTTKFLADTLENFEPTVTAGQPWLGEHVDEAGIPRLVLINWRGGQTEIDIVIPGLLQEKWVIDEYFPSTLYYMRGALLHAPTAVGHYGNFRWDQTSRGDHNNISIPLVIRGRDQVNVKKPATFPQVTLGDIKTEDMSALITNTALRGFNHWADGVDFIMKTIKPLFSNLKYQPDMTRYTSQENFVHSLYRGI